MHRTRCDGGSSVRLAPFGRFIETDSALERLRRAPGSGDGRRYIGWFMRHFGWMREGLEATEQAYKLDALDPMSANLLALARMAAGRVAEAVPVFEELVERMPNMSFPVSSLLRAYAFQQDWAAVDRLLALAEKRQLREFQDGLAFIRAKRDARPNTVSAWRDTLDAHIRKTGWVDVSRLVYTAHLGLVDEAYRGRNAPPRAERHGRRHHGPGRLSHRAHVPGEHARAAQRPALRAPVRGLGLVEFWLATSKWPDCATEVPYDFKRACAEVQGVPKDEFGF